jgi:hypothetical protein
MLGWAKLFVTVFYPGVYPHCDPLSTAQISISPDKTTVTVGPGVSGAVLQAALYDSGIRGAGVPSGGCSWVGVGGKSDQGPPNVQTQVLE